MTWRDEVKSGKIDLNSGPFCGQLIGGEIVEGQYGKSLKLTFKDKDGRNYHGLEYRPPEYRPGKKGDKADVPPDAVFTEKIPPEAIIGIVVHSEEWAEHARYRTAPGGKSYSSEELAESVKFLLQNQFPGKKMCVVNEKRFELYRQEPDFLPETEEPDGPEEEKPPSLVQRILPGVGKFMRRLKIRTRQCY